MNLFNDAIESHAEWKLALKRQIEQGQRIDLKEVANSHSCELGQWIYGEGLRYNRLPSFEAMCYNHEHFHRAAAEVVRCANAGDTKKALAMLKPEGLCAQSSNKLVRSIMDCSKELSKAIVKGTVNTGQVRDVMQSKGIKEIYSVQSSISVMDALRTMVKHNIGALAVLDDTKFIGIFTERGYAHHIVAKGGASLRAAIADLIDAETFCVTPDDSVEHCMTLMTTTHKRHLPVIENDNLVGIISIGDVIKRATSESDEKRSQLEAYIHGHYGAAA